jgi:hypothetical protein
VCVCVCVCVYVCVWLSLSLCRRRGDTGHSAKGQVNSTFRQVLILELLRPGQVDALPELASRLGHVGLDTGGGNHPQPAAGHVGEPDVVRRKVPAGDVEDTEGEGGDVGEGGEGGREEGRVEAEGEGAAGGEGRVGA